MGAKDSCSKIKTDVDVAIIGGGIQGAGVAREAALRGLSVALFEKGDFASGTSGRTSGLIHGGVRYLEQGAFWLVREAVRERYTLSQIAPHLVRQIPFLFPIYRGDRRGPWTLRAGMMLYDALAGSRGVGQHRMLTAEEALQIEPCLRSEGLRSAAQFYDCQMDDARLCLSVLFSARALGAAVFNYTEVLGLLRDGNRVCGVTVHDVESGRRRDVHARVVVNAAGPWVDAVCKMEGVQTPHLRPTKGIHVVYPRITRAHAVIVPRREDARIYFVIPWEGYSLIGTTDTDDAGDLDRITVQDDEVTALLADVGASFALAPLRAERVLARYAGVRPLVASDAPSASDASREGTIVWTQGGMLTLVGGKYTLFRKVACNAVDALAAAGYATRARPHIEPALHGGDMSAFGAYLESETPRAQKDYGITAPLLRRLIARYGTQYHAVLRGMADDPAWAEPLTPRGSHLDAAPIAVEVAYAVRHEMAVRLSDVMRRRTTLARGPWGRHGGVVDRVARQMGALLGWDATRIAREKADYLREG